MIEKIEWDGKRLAIIIRNGFEEDGVNFFTSTDNPIQLGILKHRKSVEIRPHVHKSSTRVIDSVQEVLYIQYGKVKVDFYDEDGEKVMSDVLNRGDTILLIAGGHGFKILEDSKMIEVKQGPYSGVEGDKVYLEVKQEAQK